MTVMSGVDVQNKTNNAKHWKQLEEIQRKQFTGRQQFPYQTLDPFTFSKSGIPIFHSYFVVRFLQSPWINGSKVAGFGSF